MNVVFVLADRMPLIAVKTNTEHQNIATEEERSGDAPTSPLVRSFIENHDLRVLWTPSHIDEHHMSRFMQQVNKNENLSLKSYQELYEWSIENRSSFWKHTWEYCDIKSSQPFTLVVDESLLPCQFEKLTWFPGARLNFAENLLRFNDDRVALIAASEENYSLGVERKVTFKELRVKVAQCAAALKSVGIQQGDRVAAYAPNTIETVVFLLATASLGAIFTASAPDFGTTAVLERFSQVQPKVLFTCNAVFYNGRVHDHLDKLKSILPELPSIQKVVVLPFVSAHSKDISLLPNAILYDAFVAPFNNATFEAVQVPFNHPLYILYSSGTTGAPKCLIHSHGGTLIQHLKEHILHGNMTRDDVVCQYTTAGWMMFNWLVSVLATGATVVLYDGSPLKPKTQVWLDWLHKTEVTVFGTSPKYLQTLADEKIYPVQSHLFPRLRMLLSTGSPLAAIQYDCVYEHFKKNVLLGSITGGTDIVSLFAGHCSILPVIRGQIQCRCLGMAVEAWREDGTPVLGESGDLICAKAFPAQPIGFWNDRNGQLYRKAYFSHFEGVWHHGDFVWIDPVSGGVVMLGRSDGTLNPAGVRFGSAELYNIMTRHFTPHLVLDCLVVGQKRPQDDDERVVMFLKMAENKVLDAELLKTIQTMIRRELSPRHVPSFILPIKEVPYTINGKKVEIAVKRIVSGLTVVPSGSLANPESLLQFYNIPELQ